MLVDVYRRMQGRCLQCGGSGYFYHLPEGGSTTQARFAKMNRLRVRCHCGATKVTEEDQLRFRSFEGKLWDITFRTQEKEPSDTTARGAIS